MKLFNYINNNRGEIIWAGDPYINQIDGRKELSQIHEKKLKKEGFVFIHLFGTFYFVKSKKRNYQLIPVNKIVNFASSYLSIKEKIN